MSDQLAISKKKLEEYTDFHVGWKQGARIDWRDSQVKYQNLKGVRLNLRRKSIVYKKVNIST